MNDKQKVFLNTNPLIYAHTNVDVCAEAAKNPAHHHHRKYRHQYAGVQRSGKCAIQKIQVRLAGYPKGAAGDGALDFSNIQVHASEKPDWASKIH